MVRRKDRGEPPLPGGEFAGHSDRVELPLPTMPKIDWDVWLAAVQSDTLRSELEIELVAAIKPALRRVEQAERRAKDSYITEALAVIEGFKQGPMYGKLNDQAREILEDYFEKLRHYFSLIVRVE